MTIMPDISRTTSFVDAEIAYDSLVAPSIADGYMTRAELIISRWVRDFCCQNAEADGRDEHWQDYLPAAFKAAGERFGIAAERAHELWDRSKDIRARNIPGFDALLQELREEELLQ